MSKQALLDAPDEIRNIVTLLDASLLMKDTVEEEQQTALMLVDIALVRARELAQNLESGGVRHA